MLKLLLISSLSFAAAPSSDIPAKREFPLNTAVNPCEDFHKYVCSKAEASFKLRPDRSHHTFAFNDSRERLLKVKMDFMKSLPTAKDLNPRTEQIRDVYLSCMNAPEKVRSEKSEVTRMIKEIEQIKTTEELIQYSHKNLPKGFGNFVSFWPSPNLDDPKKMDGMLYSNFMALPDHKYYENPELLKEYEKVLTLFFRSIQPQLKKSVAKEKAQALISLEQEFIKTFPVAAVRHQRWSEKRVSSQADLTKKYPHLQLRLVFANVPENLLINTPIPESLEFLNAELGKRPLQVWKDVYLYRALSDNMDDAYQKYFKAQFKFDKKFFGGPDTRPDRQERCTTVVTNYFMKEMDAALVDKVFPHFDETKVNEVGARIRASILDGLKNNTWLSKEGKAGAIAKIEKARLQLVKPHTDKEWDFMPLKKYSINNYLQNLHTFAEARWEKAMQEVREPANQDAWGMGPLTVNAYYSSNENKFVLPIGILQYPFYDKDGSVIENLGAVGAVMGHELGHSIDDSGSKYDSEGRLKQWMTTKDIMEFNLRGQKMIDQFNKIGHDGKLTLGENVADLVGLTFAYNAAFPKGVGTAENKKTFFVAYGRVWCSVTRPDFDKLMRKTDPHASGEARINEQVKHQPAFAETFQCKPGDKMTLPENERVKIW
ncbi:M13 family metallopeptidase [Bdellovibrio sp. 22V]|uniref:M13 family metallopeptidase n=1 Tax=Bdellovibrio sp. 22V TaxID=3044166 RepID=UPI0025434B95|nr:M13 family metallopeptidase [Bdellovibrio sp. 22V]WII72525.1 M13 family metallopeptidase [Bdellovibrio sp. 22V]